MVYRMQILLDQRLDTLYEATIEATDEAVLNALCMARGMEGANGNVVPALPLAEVKELVDRWAAERARKPDTAPARRPAPEGAAARPKPTVAVAKPSAARGAEGMAAPAQPVRTDGGGSGEGS